MGPHFSKSTFCEKKLCAVQLAEKWKRRAMRANVDGSWCYVVLQACEAWKNAVEESGKRARQVDDEREVAVKQRDEVTPSPLTPSPLTPSPLSSSAASLRFHSIR